MTISLALDEMNSNIIARHLLNWNTRSPGTDVNIKDFFNTDKLKIYQSGNCFYGKMPYTGKRIPPFMYLSLNYIYNPLFN